MITLTKEIKAFTVLENTPTTFKMEVEVNTTTNIDMTVDRTNNNKVTATNKQGERIIILPYLVIEAKKLANDNKPKIDLTKTNFDYHKYDKKQVLTNDGNTNNEVETMENQKVMAKVASLYKESTSSRVRNVQIDVESSIIRKAFGVKNGEIDKAIQTPKEVENFNRKTVLTDKQITEKYMEYIEFFKWAKATDSNSLYDAEIKLEYFVKGVVFFNKSLAEKLKQIAINQ